MLLSYILDILTYFYKAIGGHISRNKKLAYRYIRKTRKRRLDVLKGLYQGYLH